MGDMSFKGGERGVWIKQESESKVPSGHEEQETAHPGAGGD